MSQLPSFSELTSWLEGDCSSGSSETLQSAHALQSPNSNIAFNDNIPPTESQMLNLPKSSPQAASITKAHNTSHEIPPEAMLATAGMAPSVKIPKTPAMSHKLHDFLNKEFPNRASYKDEMHQIGRKLSQDLWTLRTEFEKTRPPREAEQAVVHLLEIIMHRWYCVEQPQNSELQRLQFLASKLGNQLKMLCDGL